MNYFLKTTFCLITCLLVNSNFILGQQISQLRGNNRDGVYDGTNLLESWPESGPQMKWVAEKFGTGFSAPTVTKSAIYVTGKIDSMEYLTAFDKTGQQKWQTQIGKVWNGTFADSRCTPTADENEVYVTDSYGTVYCFSAKDGKKIWSNEVFKNVGGAYGGWGITESLLLVDDKVIFTPGGPNTTVVALNKKTGVLAWKSESLKDTTDYASPISVLFNGKKVIFTALKNNALAVDAENGKLLCKYEFDKDRQPSNVNTPLYKDGKVLFVAGWDAYSYMLELSKDFSKFNLVWRDTIMDSEYGYVVLKDGNLYGSNFIDQRSGNWFCTDWNTGKLKYEAKWETKGTNCIAGNMLYCLDEKKGNLALVKANPEKFEIISQFKLPKGTGPCWANPVIDDGILYVRRGNTLMAFNIKK
jgi:outer membrane protein assembly factor BamB